jgi:hypothetical protein
MIKSQAIDDKWYFTGIPCKHGHIAPRLISNRSCKICSYERRKKYQDNPNYLEWIKNNKAQSCAKWQKNNKGKVNANTRKYQAAKLKRTPSWLTSFDILHMQCLYQVAVMRSAESNQEWHVDHIIPLQGETVSGLHVPWNLQVIPATDNIKKSNNQWLKTT